MPLNNNRLRWLTDDEERRLLAECEQTTHLKNLVTFLLDTGARLSEATHLTWGHLDLNRKPRGIVRFMETKSGKPRSVPLASRTQVMLTKLWEIRPEGQSRVFLVRLPGCSARKTKPQAKPFHHPYGGWYAALERSGLTDVVIHDLRHTFASRLVQKGVPLLAVSKLLGHSSLTMTMRYAHLAPDNLDDAIDRLDDPPPKPPSNGNGTEEKPGQ
ncbi:MAG: site-specific integrase [Planctomycetes bacterium]|nr:site-specific integrase [Planctomycetota bacterium]